MEKPYKFFFYPVDNSIEIIDIKSKKMHLKRIKHDAISVQDLFIGNTVEIYGRRFKIVDFGD
jgi:nucleoside-diphosphate kinase